MILFPACLVEKSIPVNTSSMGWFALKESHTGLCLSGCFFLSRQFPSCDTPIRADYCLCLNGKAIDILISSGNGLQCIPPYLCCTCARLFRRCVASEVRDNCPCGASFRRNLIPIPGNRQGKYSVLLFRKCVRGR